MDTVAHYEVLDKLGEGGMGVVYKARDLRLNRLVALKFLAPHLVPDKTAQARLLQEARAISALNHPNIATLYGLEEDTGRTFLVLEYLPGGTLSSRLAAARREGRAVPLEEATHWALEIAQGLAHAHRNGIVHRDVKSANAIFSAEGLLKITDFGLARSRGGPEMTAAGRRMGTLLYMSPEQALGRPTDHRSDVFSFGVVLYEIIAGALPFQGADEDAVTEAILHAAPPPLERLRPETPPALVSVVAKALAKEREERYQRMEDLATDLRRIEAGAPIAETVSLAPHRPPGRTAAASRRAWLVAAGVLLALAALLALQPRLRQRIVWWLPSHRIPEAKRLAILPFTNIGRDPTNQAFCDGLVEVLASKLTELERFHGSLLIVPMTEVRSQRIGSARDARQAFGVRLALTGSMQRQGSGVELVINLVDTATLHQLRSFDAFLRDAGEVQEGAVRRVAEMLELELESRAEKKLAEGRTPVPAAYDFYLQGFGYLRGYGGQTGVNNAISLFQRALAQDRRYALAHSGLAEAYWLKYRATGDRQWVEQAQETCRRALELDDRLAAVHATMALIYRGTGRYEDAVRECRRALELDAANVEASMRLASAYEAMHKLDAAEEAYQKAIEVRPGFWRGYNLLGSYYLRYGRYRDAVEPFRRVVELTPDNNAGYTNLGIAYYYLGRTADAEAMFRKSLAIATSARAYTNLGTLYYFEGRFAEAVAAMERAVELNPRDYSLWGNLADACRYVPGHADRAQAGYSRAIGLAREALKVNARDAKALSSLALYEASVQSKTEALRHVDSALRLAPSDTGVLFYSALVFELAGKRQQAVAALAAAARGGYTAGEIAGEPRLAELRKDPAYKTIEAARHLGVR